MPVSQRPNHVPLSHSATHYHHDEGMPPAWEKAIIHIMKKVDEGQGAIISYALGFIAYHSVTPEDRILHPVLINNTDIWIMFRPEGAVLEDEVHFVDN